MNHIKIIIFNRLFFRAVLGLQKNEQIVQSSHMSLFPHSHNSFPF